MLRNRVKPTACVAALLLAVSGPGCGHGHGTGAVPPAARHENSLGVVAMDQHNYVEGRRRFETALRLAPGYVRAAANLGIALYSLGKYDSARVVLERALSHDGEDLHASYTLGLIDHAQGRDYARALRLFRRVAAADPEDPQVRYYLGRTHAKLGHADSALAAFRRAIDLDPNHVSAYYALAQQLRQGGDLEAWRATLATFNRLSQAGVEGVSSAYQGQGKYAEAVAEGDFGVSGGGRHAPLAFAPPVPLPGPPPRALAVTDADGDGDIDLVSVGAAGQVTLLVNDAGRLRPSDRWSFPAGASALSLADLDDDGDRDAILAGTETAVALQEEGRFRALGDDLGGCTEAVFGDADHDGDTDLLCPGPVPRLWHNDGTGHFVQVTAAAGLGARARTATAAVFSDVDADRDVDILLAGAGAGVSLWSNRRDGTFADVTAARGLRAPGARALAVGDLVADGWMDVVTLGEAGARLFAGRARGFDEESLAAPLGATGVAAADLDNDGDLDLLFHGPGGLHAAVAADGAFAEPLAIASAPARLAAVTDVDGDGRLDVVTEAGVDINGSAAGGHLEVVLTGLNSNPDGFGARVEVKTVAARQVREYRHGQGPALHFGIGDADAVEFVRILWPSGVRQTEVDSLHGHRWQVTEVNRKGTSCPILYAWNGKRFAFVSDFLGGGIIGYLTAPGQYFKPDPDELLPIPQLAPTAGGRLVLQVANQLEEVIYLDAAELVAVDHPAGTEFVADERLLSAPPYPSLGGFAVTASRLLRRAVDGDGRDVTAALTAVDDIWDDSFGLTPIHGYAERHELVLHLGDLPAGWEHPVLLAHGWVDYAHSSSNWAAAQRGLSLMPPRLEARSHGSAWHLVTHDMGTPAGLPKGMVVDLQGVFAPGARDAQLRITTDVPVYWDRIRLGRVDDDVEVHWRRRAFTTADLHWRGYPAHTAIRGTFAYRYDYDDLHRSAPWGTHAGAFTGYGDVAELVGAVDDRFAILGHGDELTLQVEADAFPPPPPGWQRTWLFYSDGFGKDMDPHSAHALSVEPLPFHAMSGYPYPAAETYPATPENVAYILNYNTRWIEGYYR